MLADAAVTEGTLDHALRVLVERLLQRPDRLAASRARCGIGARLVGGGSWSATPPCASRPPTAARIRLALHAKLRELPAPAEELTVEIGGLAPGNRQSPLFREEGEARAARLAERRRPGARRARRERGAARRRGRRGEPAAGAPLRAGAAMSTGGAHGRCGR